MCVCVRERERESLLVPLLDVDASRGLSACLCVTPIHGLSSATDVQIQ